MRTLLAVAMVLSAAAGAEEFQSLFDGKSFEGWAVPDERFWSIEDGAITAQSTPENLCESNQYLVWQGGEIADFELKLKFRLEDNRGNSGIQFRSEIREDGEAVGPQADICDDGSYFGSFNSERTGRKSKLVLNGHKTIAEEDGTFTTMRIGENAANRDNGEWNDYHIIARGNHIICTINGVVSAEFIDNQPEYFRPSGVLGLQLRANIVQKVQFKDIYLKRLE